MMLMGLGSGISAAGARNKPFYEGIAPGAQAYAQGNLAMRDRAAQYQQAQQNYQLQRDYKGMQEKGMQRQYDMQDAGMKMLAEWQRTHGGATPGFDAPQPQGDQPIPGMRAPAAPLMGPPPQSLPGGPTALNAVFSDAQKAFPDLSISSAGRTPEQNTAIGGAPDSQHLHSNAYDIPWQGKTPEQRQAIYQHFSNDPRVGGIGAYDTHIHVDTRPQRTTWGTPPVSPQAAQGGSPRIGQPQMPGPPPDTTPLDMAAALGIPAAGAIAGREKALYGYETNRYKWGTEAAKNTRESANAPVTIGADGQPTVNTFVPQAAAAKAAAEATAKLAGEREATYPAEWGGKTGDDLRAAMPQNWRTIVDELNSGKLAMSDLPSRAAAAGVNPSKVDFIALTKQVNPDWNPRTGEQQKTFNEHVSDPSNPLGATRFAINTAYQHIDQYQDLMRATGNHDQPLVNSILDHWNTQQGNPKFTNAHALQHFLATETAKVVKGAGTLNLPEVDAGVENLSTASSWDQTRGTLATWMHAMQARENTINDVAESVGIPEKERTYLGKSARAAKEHFHNVQGMSNKPEDKGAGGPQQAQGSATPSKAAIGHLQMNPNLSADFDAKYGPGSAARVLGAR